ncbi:MAG: formate dehydrogenase accessory sulfurtransferase FdhD [Bacteroidetes bacterium]|nr:formate dehydrogenase accessory sulfurtransferase FdhD [Bacteroidota bacterium]
MNESSNKIAYVNIRKVDLTQCDDTGDALAIEEPLEIQLQFGKQGEFTNSIAVTMRTPGNDLELAVGFLFTEGIIKSHHQLKSNRLDESDNKIRITLQENEVPSLKNIERNFYTTSSCGVCGKASIEAIKTISAFNIHGDHAHIEARIIQQLEKELIQQQTVFSKTGGLHASALFDDHGQFILLREDVGRHNALDKLIGAALQKNSLPLSNKILLLSGRASFELIQKASMAGIPVVAAVGAPSSLAVSLAKEAGMTLIGFLRNDRFNIYCGDERLALHNSGEGIHTHALA